MEVESGSRRIEIAWVLLLWMIAVIYAYGALVHVLNLVGLTTAPPPGRERLYRILDLVYLALDLFVVLGLVRRRNWGITLFYGAALSQLLLYSLLWDYFAIDDETASQLVGLIVFHGVSLALVTGIGVARRGGRKEIGRAALESGDNE